MSTVLSVTSAVDGGASTVTIIIGGLALATVLGAVGTYLTRRRRFSS